MAINTQNSPSADKLAQDAGQTGKVNQKMQSGGEMLNVILLIVLIGLAVFGTFLFFDKGNVMAHTNQLEKDIADLNTQIATFKDQKVEVSKNAQDTLGTISQNEIRWSEVISEVNKLLPTDASGQRTVQVISYSGSELGRIALNMVTQPAGLPPFDSVSALIATFNNSVFFKDAYVPSISKGQTDTGESTLSFVLNLSYQKPETGTADMNLGLAPVKVPVATGGTPKIPTN
jgi:hypothetical protein